MRYLISSLNDCLEHLIVSSYWCQKTKSHQWLTSAELLCESECVFGQWCTHLSNLTPLQGGVQVGFIFMITTQGVGTIIHLVHEHTAEWMLLQKAGGTKHDSGNDCNIVVCNYEQPSQPIEFHLECTRKTSLVKHSIPIQIKTKSNISWQVIVLCVS